MATAENAEPDARTPVSPATRLAVWTGIVGVLCTLLLAIEPHVPGRMSIFFHLLYTYDRPVAEASVLLVPLAAALCTVLRPHGRRGRRVRRHPRAPQP